MPKPNVKFVNDPITGGCIATLPHTDMQLVWYPHGDGTGPVKIGKAFVPGAVLYDVTNPKYDYASSLNHFKAIARALAEETVKAVQEEFVKRSLS